MVSVTRRFANKLKYPFLKWSQNNIVFVTSLKMVTKHYCISEQAFLLLV